MPTFKWRELETKPFDPQHASASGAVYRGEKLEVALVRYPAATEVRPHATAREQVHAILTGRARYRVGDEEKAVGPGEAVLIRPNVRHAVEILADLEAVIFTDLGSEAGAGQGEPGGKAFYEWDEMESDFITPKYSAAQGPTLVGERMEVVYMFFPAGTEGKLHSHPNEQIQVVLRGRAVGIIEGEEYPLEPGGGILFPGNATHGARILEDYTAINCKNIVQGWSTYHASWRK